MLDLEITAFYKLLKTSKQFYLLGPNIRCIPADFSDRFKVFMIVSDFITVATDIKRVDKSQGQREALVQLAKDIDGSALIYCQSPSSVRRIAQLMVERQANADGIEVD